MTAPLDLDAIRARADAATPGRWVWASGGSINTGRGWNRPTHDDAKFIAHARDDVPALLAAVAERDEQIAVLQERIAARDRAGLGAVFLADAIGIENVEKEIEAATAKLTAPYREKIAALQAAADELQAVYEEVSRQRDSVQAQLDAVRESRANHPACDRHSDGGPVTCGWKRAVLGIDAALASAPSDVLDRVKREAAAAALEEAAQKWSWGEWANAPRLPDRVAERIALGPHVAGWLRTRAAAIRAEGKL